MSELGQRPFTKARLLQSLLAAGFIFLMFLVMNSLKSHLAVASLGASAFLTFSFPHRDSSRTRFLLGGYFAGAFWGVVFSAVIRALEQLPAFPVAPYIVGCALAVFCTMFTMTALNVEHAPSCALAIAVATADLPVALGAVAFGCVSVLCGIRYMLRRWLVNL